MRTYLPIRSTALVSENLLIWLTILNTLTGLLYATAAVAGLVAFRAVLRRHADRNEDEQEDAKELEAAVARVLSRRLELMLTDELIPEGLAEMLEQIETFSESEVGEEVVRDAWCQAVSVARVRLGDLTEYHDSSLIAHATHVARSMYGLARAAWRGDETPEALLLGQAYESTASIIEETVIGEWPSTERELRAMVEYDTRRPTSREEEPATSTAHE